MVLKMTFCIPHSLFEERVRREIGEKIGVGVEYRKPLEMN